MKQSLKFHMFLTVGMISCFTTALACNPNEDNFCSQVRKYRNQVVDIDGIDSQNVGLAYMVAPEEEGRDIRVGHAVISIVGENEGDFWAADFRGDYSNLGNVLGNIFASTHGIIRTTEDTNDPYAIFTTHDQSNIRDFSIWPRKVWKISQAESDRIKDHVRRELTSPPRYSVSGLNINPRGQDVHTYNSSMWAQKILIENTDIKKIRHIRIARGSSDDCLKWLAGSKNKRMDAVGSVLMELPGIAIDILSFWKIFNSFQKTKQPYGNKALKVLPDLNKGILHRVFWTISQFSDLGKICSSLQVEIMRGLEPINIIGGVHNVLLNAANETRNVTEFVERESKKRGREFIEVAAHVVQECEQGLEMGMKKFKEGVDHLEKGAHEFGSHVAREWDQGVNFSREKLMEGFHHVGSVARQMFCWF